MKIFFVSLLLVASSIGAPVDPEDEVELIEPKRTSAFDGEDDEGSVISGGIPIIIIRGGGGSGNPFFNPFGGGFPFGQREAEEPVEELPGIFEDFPFFSQQGPISPPGFFPGRVEESEFPVVEADSASAPCGFLCQVFRQVQTQIQHVQADVDEIRRKQEEQQNEIETDEVEGEDDGPYHNTTYTEQVLPDGSVVKINRTVITDTNENGATFLFHSTSFHNIDNSDENVENDENIEDVENIEDDIENDDAEEDVPLLTEIIDEFGQNDDENVGVDGGLIQ